MNTFKWKLSNNGRKHFRVVNNFEDLVREDLVRMFLTHYVD